MLPHEELTHTECTSMKNSPDWYQKAAQALATGVLQVAVAKEIGISVRSLRRHLAAPGSILAALVAQEKAQLVAATADQRGTLLERALSVLEKNLDGEGKIALDSAKALISKLLPNQVVQTTEETKPPPEISADQAAQEVALSLPALADLARTGQLSVGAVMGVRSACIAFLEDDLRPRQPIDTEADQVSMLGEAENVVSEPSVPNGSIVPIRHWAFAVCHTPPCLPSQIDQGAPPS